MNFERVGRGRRGGILEGGCEGVCMGKVGTESKGGKADSVGYMWWWS